MLRIPHCLDNRLTGGGKVVSSMHRPRSIPEKHYFSASDNHFCQSLSELQGIERLKLKKFILHIWSRTHDLPTCNIVSQLLREWVQEFDVPQLSPLVAGFPWNLPGFECRSGHVGFEEEKVAMWRIFNEHFSSLCQSSFQARHHLQSGEVLQ
jgi:hypothetical protein